MPLLLLFDAKRGVNLDERGDDEGDEAAKHDPPEEIDVTQRIADVTCKHAWYEHTGILYCCADAEHRCALMTCCEIHKEEGTSREAETIAQLFNEEAGADNPQVRHLCKTQIDIDEVWQ